MTSKMDICPHHLLPAWARRRRRAAAGLRHPGRGPHRTAAQVCPLGGLPGREDGPRGGVRACQRLRRRGRGAGRRQAGHGLARGFTYVQAHRRADKVVPLVQRQEDAQFTSSSSPTSTAASRPWLTPKARTSRSVPPPPPRHLMPRHFLAEQGINPERDFAHVASPAPTTPPSPGSPPAGAGRCAQRLGVEKLVEEGKVDTRQGQGDLDHADPL